ncbi:MAG: hypothetical protein ACT4P1_14505 [Sporichthyaceae bacterium]
MDRTFAAGIGVLASAFAFSTLGMGNATASMDDEFVAKREDSVGQVVVAEDDDDDDDLTGNTGNSVDSALTAPSADTSDASGLTGNTDLTGNSGNSADSGVSRASNDSGTRAGQSALSHDATNSKFSKVSRDRDISRGDLTRDLTNDGKGKNNVDDSRNSTNDQSRNDTR